MDEAAQQISGMAVSQQTLADFLGRVVAGHGDRVAVVDAARQGHPALTFAGLGAHVDAAARALADSGLARGDVLLNWLPNVSEWLVLYFAAARLGMLTVPLNTRFRERELADVLSVTDAAALVVPTGFLAIDFAGITRRALDAGSLEEARERWPSLRALFTVDCSPSGKAGAAVGIGGARPLAEALDVASGAAPDFGRPEDPVAAFSTSGTTGRPKLALHDQAGVARHSGHVAEAFGLDPDARMLGALPLCGVFGFNGCLATLLAGGAVVLQPVFDAEEATALFAEQRISHCYGPDTMLGAILDAASGDELRSWRAGGFANFSGEGAAVVRRLQEGAGVRLRGLYGSSECFALMSIWPDDAPEAERMQGGGYPVSPDIEVRTADPESGQVLDPHTQGELQVRGYNVTAGYLGNDDATAAAFTPDGWFRTGDLGYTQGNGSFVYLSRLGDSLRLGGYLVDPVEIEEHLMSHDAVRASVVVGVEVPGKGDVAVGFVQLQDGTTAVPDQLRVYCRERIAAFKVPSRILVLDALPTVDGPNGVKIQRGRLRKLAEAELTG